MNSVEEKFYETAGEELATKNINRGAWAKAFSTALGDEAKTKAIYIQIRVDQLRGGLANETRMRDDHVSHGLPTIAVSTRWDFWTGAKIVIKNTGERALHLQSCVITNPRTGQRSCIRNSRMIASREAIEISDSFLSAEHITLQCAEFAQPLHFWPGVVSSPSNPTAS